LQESIAFTGAQIIDEQVKVTELEERLEDLKEAVEEKRRVFDEKRSTIDTLRRENQALQLSRFDSEKKVAVADTSIQNLQRTLHQLSEEQKVRTSQLETLEAEKKEKETELENKKTELQQLQEHQDRTKEQILATQNMMEGMRNNLAEESRKLDARTNEYDLLKSLVDSMEGYPESVKFLHNNSGWNKDAPLLSDLIFVNEEYRAAVENVLDQYLNYYVVNNLQEGLQAISLLADR
jgi:chromosome segregation protein